MASAEYCRQWRLNNPDKVKAYALKPAAKIARDKARKRWRNKNLTTVHNGSLLRKYGITLDGYAQLYSDQHGVCAICKRNAPSYGSSKKRKALHVDHCHASGKVRGLLCGNCNLALGHLKDDVLRAKALVEYLERG